MSVVCAADIGTSAVRAIAIGADGAILAARRRARRGVGSTTFDAELLLADTFETLRELALDIDPGTVEALAFSGHVGVVMVDATERPVGPASLWSDSRGLPQLSAAWADDAASLRIVGRPMVTNSALALAYWLRANDGLGRVRWLLGPKDYLVLALTGVAVTDRTSAAYTLAYDVGHDRWATDLIAPTGLSDAQLPSVVPGSEIVGRLHATGAAHIGFSSGLPIVTGGPDGTCGAVALAGDEPGIVVDVAGTTDVLSTIIDKPTLSAGALLNPYVVRGLWTKGGPTGLTGGGVEQLVALLGYADVASAIADLDPMLPPGSDGLTVVPLLSGSRFPTWNAAERGSVGGIGASHRRSHIVQAALEGSAFVVREALERIATADARVVLAGGLTRSTRLAQLRANVFGRPLLVSDDPDVSAVGAGILAAVAAGIHPSLGAASLSMRPHLMQFVPENDVTYDDAYRRWQSARAVAARSSAVD